MRRLKALLILSLCVCLLASTVRCFPGLAGSLEEDAVHIVLVDAKPLEQSGYSLDDSASVVASGANDFAFQLSAALAAKAGGGNFVCSPYSVWMPLAALANALEEEYVDELLAAINAPGLQVYEVNQAASRMLYDLTNQESKLAAKDYGAEYEYNPLQIANAIFVDDDMTLHPDFAQVFMDSFRGVSMQVDFSAPEAVEAINQWASDNTEGMITDIVQGFAPSTFATIANAVYFADRWDWEFSPEETKEGIFQSPQGETSAFFMRREGEQLPYYEDDDLQAILLAFKTGGGMLILLPKDGDAGTLLSDMTTEYFNQIARGADKSPGKLLLPRFSIASDVMDLSETLSALGMSFLFDDFDAPFASKLIWEGIPVWLSSVFHKAAIEVDEKGTTAAAVTIMEMAGSAPPEPAEPFEMICDRPFAFILYNRTYDGGQQVLFTGIVNQPQDQ